MIENSPIPGLTLEGCRRRQERFREMLRRLGIDAAWIGDPRHVHYFTGYWARSVFARWAFIERDGPTVLVAAIPPEQAVAADEIVVFESNRLGTLVDDPTASALGAIEARLSGRQRLGVDVGIRPGLVPAIELVDLHSELLAIRRCKDSDEIELLRFAIAAAEAAYGWAKSNLDGGLTEVEFYAGMQQAAVNFVGEGIGEFGNDFQIGAAGSAPRRRSPVNGEMAIFDVSVVVRGYASDMCRSFVVGGSPSRQQQQAHRLVMNVLEFVEKTARAGVRCQQLYEDARRMLASDNGWSFPHHLGHGIGLSGHESPRLNPHWDDALQVGDVFTVEPGLYHPELRAGLRVEQIYHVSESGLERLTTFPTELA